MPTSTEAMRRRSSRILLAISAGFLFASTRVRGQTVSPTGDLFGTVVDEQNQPMREVAVTLAGPGATQTSTTDAKGDFHFLHLSPGVYALTLEHPGFTTMGRSLTISPGRNVVVTLALPVAGATESVTVGGGVDQGDSRKTKTGADFGEQELQSIPTTRDPWALLRQVPGVLVGDVNVGGSNAGTQSAFVGKGSGADQNLYNVDGVTVSMAGTTVAFFDFDSLENIDVTTGGSDPALATPGVTLNLVTRRGTNLFQGSARALYASGAGWDYGIEAGGPAWKDRLWLWGAFARNDVPGQTYVTNTGEPVQQTLSLEYGNAKLNAQLAPSTSVTGSYLDFDRTVDGRGAGPSRSQPSTWDNTFRTQSFRGEVSEVFSPQINGSAYFAGYQSAFRNVPQGGVDQQADLIDFVWQNSFIFRTVNGSDRQAGATTSAFFDTGDLRHELKFGFGYRHTSSDSLSTWPGDQLYGNNANGAPGRAQAAVTRAKSPRFDINYYDVYAGDTLQLGRLSLGLGVRFDYQQGKNLASAVPANPEFPDLLPAVAYGGDPSYPITWRLVQPRISATYALGPNRNTLVRGSYSRFADLLGNEVTSINPFPGIAQRLYYWDDFNGNQRVEPNEVILGRPGRVDNVDPNNPGAAVPVNRIAPDFEPPTTTEFLVGVEQALSAGLSASLTYTHRAFRNPEFSPLIGTQRSDYVFEGLATGVAHAGGFVLPFSEPYYALTLLPAPVGVELQNRSDFTKTYDGVELQILKAFSQGWMLRASAAWNDWRQKVGPGAIVDPNNELGGTNRSGPVVEATETGPTAPTIYVNARWQFNVSGLAPLPFGVEVGANLFGREGYPVLYGVELQNLGTNRASPILQIGSVGAYRLAPVFVLDLHLERTFSLGPRIAATALFDCFNVADSHTVLARDGDVGLFDPSVGLVQSETFNDPVQVLSSRIFRGGVRIAF